MNITTTSWLTGDDIHRLRFFSAAVFLDFDPVGLDVPGPAAIARIGAKPSPNRPSNESERELVNKERAMNHRFSIVITRLSERHCLPEFFWLEDRFDIEEGDWIVLSQESWRSLAQGSDATVHDLERKLMMKFYAHEPQIIAVVGHRASNQENIAELIEQTRQIMRRVEACLLPVEVLGFIVDANAEAWQLTEARDAEMDCEPENSLGDCELIGAAM